MPSSKWSQRHITSAVTSDSSAKPSDLGGERAANDEVDDSIHRPSQMAVQSPQGEDLQRSYATIVGNNFNPEGCYGDMSM